jgi:hypothetical protein
MGKNSKNKEKILSFKSLHKIIRANMSELMNLDFESKYKKQKENSFKRLKSICDSRSDKEKITYVTFLDDAIHYLLVEKTQDCFPQSRSPIISPDYDTYELDEQKAVELLRKAGEKTFVEIADLLLKTDAIAALYKNAPEMGKYE